MKVASYDCVKFDSISEVESYSPRILSFVGYIKLMSLSSSSPPLLSLSLSLSLSLFISLTHSLSSSLSFLLLSPHTLSLSFLCIFLAPTLSVCFPTTRYYHFLSIDLSGSCLINLYISDCASIMMTDCPYYSVKTDVSHRLIFQVLSPFQVAASCGTETCLLSWKSEFIARCYNSRHVCHTNVALLSYLWYSLRYLHLYLDVLYSRETWV